MMKYTVAYFLCSMFYFPAWGMDDSYKKEWDYINTATPREGSYIGRLISLIKEKKPDQRGNPFKCWECPYYPHQASWHTAKTEEPLKLLLNHCRRKHLELYTNRIIDSSSKKRSLGNISETVKNAKKRLKGVEVLFDGMLCSLRIQQEEFLLRAVRHDEE